jgi:hypothetical protein
MCNENYSTQIKSYLCEDLFSDLHTAVGKLEPMMPLA